MEKEIETREELLERASQFERKEERLKFIMQYFLRNVKYDYAYLFAKGYVQGNISEVETNYKLGFDKMQSGQEEKFVLTRQVLKGKSEIFEDIIKLRDKNEGDYVGFISQLKNYITNFMREHIDNNEIIIDTVQELIAKIEQDLAKKVPMKYGSSTIDLGFDISAILIDYLLNAKKRFPTIIEGGILKKGVCEAYSEYLVPLLREVGIEAYLMDGTSELEHAWILAKINGNYQSIDLTRAVFIRDGFKGIPQEQKSEDWLYHDLGKMFRMQKTRSISAINGMTLKNIIDASNYTPELFSYLMTEILTKKEGHSVSNIEEGLEI